MKPAHHGELISPRKFAFTACWKMKLTPAPAASAYMLNNSSGFGMAPKYLVCTKQQRQHSGSMRVSQCLAAPRFRAGSWSPSSACLQNSILAPREPTLRAAIAGAMASDNSSAGRSPCELAMRRQSRNAPMLSVSHVINDSGLRRPVMDYVAALSPELDAA